MTRIQITRNSDGKTIDLEKQYAEESELPARSHRSTLVDGTGNIISTLNPLPTTATITGDVNVDSVSTDTNGFVGKPSGGDFDTAYGSATTIVCTNLPSSHPTLYTEDILTIVITR